MNCRVVWGIRAAAIVLASAACEVSKSSHPLSPTVAGPIPGVVITAPKMLEPQSGARIPVDQQPVTLMIENASSNGVRPLSYVFEVATDAGFTNKVFSRQGVDPGTEGRTRLRLPNPLATERGYYWRARAEDGANTGPFADAASFNVFTPIIIEAPTPAAPAPNAAVNTIRPQFVVNNARRSGPVGPITYTIELSENVEFITKVAAWTAAEQSAQTRFDTPVDLKYTTAYFWHVRAADSTTIGPWSPTMAFSTPAEPQLPPPSTPGPLPPGGPAPGDAIDLNQAAIMNSPPDVARWPATATLRVLDLGQGGVFVDFTKKNGAGSWPDYTPPGWTGPLQYTLWIVLNINGRWYASGCIQFWRGLDRNGGPPALYAQNWYYDSRRWGPMTGHQPATGEQVGFLVTAGDARNNGGTALKERSNVVMIPFPGPAGGVFRF
jgi:hypothetical protein